MKRTARLASVILFGTVSAVLADPTVDKLQQTLKDQGFYYGEVTGKIDTDTTAAIRRYQIRNGLKVSGELDAETRKSLGLAAGAAAKPTAQPTRAPVVPDSREQAPTAAEADTDRVAPPPPSRPAAPYTYAPEPHALQREAAGIFDGTPYEVAPPELQRRLIIGAQTMLARRGYYRSGIDGSYGPGTELALRAFQSRSGLPPTGRFDMETLAALGLLPGERAPRFDPPHRRVMRPPDVEIGPDGEPIYVPND
jgi:peptidoglycan hydrolase-like protein with peptidoglycan-binding domain